MSQKFDNFNFHPQFVNPQGGAPGTITIAQAGIPVAGSPVSGLNFTNPATPVTISGGVATVNLFGDGTTVAFAPIGSAPNADGASIDGSGNITLQPASAAYGGLVTTAAQSFAGAKAFTGTITVPTIYGANTGGATLNLYGNSVDANHGTVKVNGTANFSSAINLLTASNINWPSGSYANDNGSGTATFYGVNAATISNGGGSSFTLDSAGDASVNASAGNVYLAAATGYAVKANPGITLPAGNTGTGLAWADGASENTDGYGTLTISANSIDLTTTLGVVRLDAASQLQWADGPVIQSDGSNNLDVTANNVNISNNLVISSPGGQIQFHNGGTLQSDDFGNIAVGGNLVITGGQITFGDGSGFTDTGSGAIQVGGNLYFYSSGQTISWTGGAGLSTDGAGTLDLNGSLISLNAIVRQNDGNIIEWGNGGTLSASGGGLQFNGSSSSYYKTSAGTLTLSGSSAGGTVIGYGGSTAATFGSTNTISTATTFSVGATMNGLNKVQGTGAALQIAQASPNSAVSASSTVALRANSSSAHLELSENAGTYYQVGTTYSQSIIGGGAVTQFVPAASNAQVIFTASSNVTSLGISTTGAYAGQMVTLLLRQGTSVYTWPTAFGNCKLVGGTFAKTSTASSVDSITFRFDGTSWWEMCRSLNES
jgi:hypothetical protein